VKDMYEKSLIQESSSKYTQNGASYIKNDFTTASITISSLMIIKDIALFLKGQPGEWIKGRKVLLNILHILNL
jgi:hypothetical protein